MIKYILDNKEWIFSGIGVLFLSVFLTLIRYLIIKKRKVITHTISEISEDFKIEANQNNDISQFDIPKIMESLDDIPPFQLEEFQDKYIGLNINWTAIYSSAHKKDDDCLRIGLDLEVKLFRPITLWCEVKLSEYKQFKILKKNTKIRIIGKIEKFESYHIELANVKLIFLDKVVI